MKGRTIVFGFIALFSLGIGLTIAGGGIRPTYRRTEQVYYLTAEQTSFVRPGLNLQVQKVEFQPPNVSVTFQITDDAGQPLDRLGIDTPGAVSTSFILARIRPGDTQYTAYTTRTQTSPITGVTAVQAGTDQGGTYTNLGNGVYQYTFGFKLPSDVAMNATHTVGMYASRDLSDFGMGTEYANATFNFVPSGAPVTQVRDVVSTQACNQCHDPLSAHGGARRDTKLCILCHQPQTTDPDTGNTVDFKVLIHKIHMGANLPSVSGQPLNRLGTSGSSATSATGATQAPIAAGAAAPGKPYEIIGYRQGVHDFSSVIWPQDVRNCTTCHQGGTQSDNYKTNPSRAACGSCHDNVNFETGENHPGGVQLDDTKCTICHQPDGTEFDLSVTGAHTIPTNSKQLKGLNVKILDVTNTKPGDHPTVSFTVTDNAENPVDASSLNRLSFEMAGPTTDYTFMLAPSQMEDARQATAGPTGYTYTFKSTIPSDATGTFAIGAEAYRNVTIPGSLLGQPIPVRESAFNPVFYFSVDGSAVVPRRTVVAMDNCNRCHKSLALHGGMRRNVEYCVLCHNPLHTDEEYRPADQMPAQALNSRLLFHRVHRGENLETDWTIYGYGGHAINYNGLRFPGDLRDCAECHVDSTYTVPLPDGLADTPTPRLFYSPLTPTASACLGCHDGEDAAAHAHGMTAPFGESCPVCHEEGADYAVTKVHAR